MNRHLATKLLLGLLERRGSVGVHRVEWWDKHDEGWTKRGDVRPRNLIALTQLVVGVLIVTAIIVYLAS